MNWFGVHKHGCDTALRHFDKQGVEPHTSCNLSSFLCPSPVSPELLACFHRGEIKWNHNYRSLLLFTGRCLHKGQPCPPGRRQEREREWERERDEAENVQCKKVIHDTSCNLTFYSSVDEAAQFIILRLKGAYSDVRYVWEQMKLRAVWCPQRLTHNGLRQKCMDKHNAVISNFLALWGKVHDVTVWSLTPEWQTCNT